MDSDAEVLQGGIANQGSIVRIGGTVHRPLRPASTATHALLRHLEKVGFEGAPRFLGIDDQGREVLTYVPGAVALAPLPAWVLTDDALRSLARLLADYHAAVADFQAGEWDWPSSPPAPFDDGLVSHNDPNIDNVVFRDGIAVALIDFDLASPGSRLWDVACAARLWAPLRDDLDITDERRGQSLRRFRLFVDSCALTSGERNQLVEAVGLGHDWVYDIVASEGELGNANYSNYWANGGADRAERTRTWLAAHATSIRQALEGDP